MADSATLRFTEDEVRDLTSMIYGAPVFGDDLMLARAIVWAMESLNTGERPRDPARGGRLLDMPEALLYPAAAALAKLEQPI